MHRIAFGLGEYYYFGTRGNIPQTMDMKSLFYRLLRRGCVLKRNGQPVYDVEFGDNYSAAYILKQSECATKASKEYILIKDGTAADAEDQMKLMLQELNPGKEMFHCEM